MQDLIHDELAGVLQQWHEGTAIRTIELGHQVKLETQRNGESEHVRNPFRQRQAHDYCFALIREALERAPIAWPEFQALTEIAPKDLTLEERQAAESLAWKALARGWRNAVTGFADSRYITIARKADA